MQNSSAYRKGKAALIVAGTTLGAGIFAIPYIAVQAGILPLLFFILVLMSTTSLFAADKGIVVDVSLSPAGSFQIKSAKVKGKMVKSGDGKK